MSLPSRLAGLLAVVAMAVAFVATASPASAHAQLESINPGPGATLKDLPQEVNLSFSEDVRTPAFVQLTNPDGVNVAKGDVSIVDNKVTQTTGAPAGSGKYTVSYRITSADGHPVSGSVSFTVLSNAGAGRGTTGSQASGSPQPAGDDSGGIGTTQLVLLLGVLVVGLAVLVFATRRALSQSVAMVEERKRTEDAKGTKNTKKRGRTQRT
jgi:copper resistance protein C